MNPRNFVSELKRRNVIRFAGLYLVGAWLIVQVAGTVLPMFGAPEWLPRTIVLLLVIGFIPALVFSWAFELTPQGLKRDEEVPPEQSIAPQTGRRMNRLIIAVLVLALAYFAFDKFVLTPRRTAALPGEQKAAVDTNSVAVLAFANLSDDKGSEYFSDGISEELLTVLAKNSRFARGGADVGFFFQRQERDRSGDWTEARRGPFGRRQRAQSGRERAHRRPANSRRRRATRSGRKITRAI